MLKRYIEKKSFFKKSNKLTKYCKKSSSYTETKSGYQG